MIKSILFLVLLISFSALIFSLPPNPQCRRIQESEDDDHRANCKKVVNQFIAFLSQEEAYFTSENNIEIENTTSTYNPFEISASNPFYNNPWGTVLLQLAGNTDNSSFGNRNYQFQYAILLNPTVNFGSIDIFIGERCSNGSSVVQLLNSSDSNSTTDGLTGSFDASDLRGDLTNSGLSDLLANIRESNASIAVTSGEDDDTNSTSTFVLKGKIIEVGKSYIIYDAFEKLSTLENLETLSELIELTNLTEFVRTQNNYTLFAPTNQAISDAAARLNITTYDNTTLPVLSRLLQYHVVSGVYTSGDFTNNTITLNTVLTSSEGNGTTIVVTGNESCNFSINNGQAEIIVPDVEAANAVIHVVNSVLLPEDLNVLLE